MPEMWTCNNLDNGGGFDMSDLRQITRKLGGCYKRYKAAEREKNAVRNEFFEAADKELAQQVPAQVTETVYAASETEAHDIAEQRFPRFEVLDVEGVEAECYRVGLEEKTKYRPFIFVNPEDGQVYQRQVAEGAPLLDEERLKEKNPMLYEMVTMPARVLRPFEELDAETLAALSRYCYTAKPIVKLAAPKKAKEEDLE